MVAATLSILARACVLNSQFVLALCATLDQQAGRPPLSALIAFIDLVLDKVNAPCRVLIRQKDNIALYSKKLVAALGLLTFLPSTADPIMERLPLLIDFAVDVAHRMRSGRPHNEASSFEYDLVARILTPSKERLPKGGRRGGAGGQRPGARDAPEKRTYCKRPSPAGKRSCVLPSEALVEQLDDVNLTHVASVCTIMAPQGLRRPWRP